MKIISYSFCVILFFFFPGILRSQDAIKALDRVYGPDQTLCNGRKYDYFLPPGTKGNQYMLSPDYVNGTVTLMGKCYRNVNLNYDIFNQKLLLRYTDEMGALNIIEVSDAWMQSFTLDKMNFEYLSTGPAPRIYQELGQGSLRILYFWRKSMNPEVAVGATDFVFTPPIRESYVLIDGNLDRYRTRNSFIRIFDRARRQEIKSYLHKNRIRLKRSSDQAISDMITFIASKR